MYLLNKQTNKKKQNKFNKADLTKRKRAIMEIANRSTQGFTGGSVVKNLPALQETLVESLGQENPQEKEMATYSSILAWEIQWTEEPGGLQSIGS